MNKRFYQILNGGRADKPQPPPPVRLQDKSTGDVLADLIFGALRTGDEDLADVAEELLARRGHGAVRQLTVEARKESNSLKFRVRLLSVIGRIGTLDAGVHMEIFALSSDPNPTIAHAAAVAMAALRRAGELAPPTGGGCQSDDRAGSTGR